MADLEEDEPSPLWRWLRIFALSLVVVFFCGVVAGYVSAHLEGDKPWTLVGLVILAAMVSAGLLAGWLLYRTLRNQARVAPLTRRERLNRNILVVSGATGFLAAMLVAVGTDGSFGADAMLSNTPLPTGIAVVLVLMLGLGVPALSYYWHRSAVDEQEADAYKFGALIALYLYMCGAPVWWFAWRGGFAPEPDGIVIYCVVTLTMGVIWIWKKYR